MPAIRRNGRGDGNQRIPPDDHVGLAYMGSVRALTVLGARLQLKVVHWINSGETGEILERQSTGSAPLPINPF